MNKIKTLKYVVLVCMGITFWAPPCYSFGFPTFDIAEVGATIKGIVTDVQSYVSTVQSTITESKLLQSLGDSVSALTKFRDEASEKLREAEKAARKLKSSERLAKLREKLEAEQGGKEEITPSADEEEAKVPEVAPEEDWDEGSWSDDKEGAADQEEPFTPKNDLIEDEDLWLDFDGEEAELPVKDQLPSDGDNEDDLWSDGDVDEELPASGGQLPDADNAVPSEGNVAPVLNKGVVVRPAILDGKAPVQLDGDLISPVKQETVPAVNPATGAGKTTDQPVGNKSTLTKPVLNTAPMQRTPFLKQSMSVNYDLFTDRSSFASMSVKTGTNEDGRFLFSDIIAQKCSMGYSDAQDEDKVKDCIKTWVICLAGCEENDLDKCSAEEAQKCLKEYKQAMQDQVAADLAASLNDKEYSASFDSDVADDLSNKSQALSTERDEVSYSGEVNRASQEILNRLLYSMSSEVLHNSFMAIEHIKKDYYDE